MDKQITHTKRLGGFALIDPLVGMLFLATILVGAFNAWKLAEYKADKARIDARVTQILREGTDYMTYVSYDLLPVDGAQWRAGFLLQPLDPSTGTYKSVYPFTVAVAVTTTNADTPAEAKEIILTLTYTTNPQPAAGDSPHQTISSNALTRTKM